MSRMPDDYSDLNCDQLQEEYERMSELHNDNPNSGFDDEMDAIEGEMQSKGCYDPTGRKKRTRSRKSKTVKRKMKKTAKRKAKKTTKKTTKKRKTSKRKSLKRRRK